jgi:signal transduction histidine kinase
MSSRVPEMDLLRKIEAQAFRAAGIAGSVLNFSRRREGETPQILDPGPVVAECLTLFETHMKGKKIRMTTERAASLPNIRGHRGRIQQAVINLLMNAADALPQGGEIRLGIDREGESLRIRVSDNGVGIPSDILPRIFEPFFTARPDGKGTGLGLAVVRQIVEEHQGSVEVESIPGAGSTFTLLLPAVAALLQEVPSGA